MSENIPENRACSFAECGYAHYALGLCVAHYAMRRDLLPMQIQPTHNRHGNLPEPHSGTTDSVPTEPIMVLPRRGSRQMSPFAFPHPVSRRKIRPLPQQPG